MLKTRESKVVQLGKMSSFLPRHGSLPFRPCIVLPAFNGHKGLQSAQSWCPNSWDTLQFYFCHAPLTILRYQATTDFNRFDCLSLNARILLAELFIYLSHYLIATGCFLFLVVTGFRFDFVVNCLKLYFLVML